MDQTKELDVSRKKGSTTRPTLSYVQYRMVDRVHVFRCSHHLPGPALHVPYRHCQIPTPERAARFRIFSDNQRLKPSGILCLSRCDSHSVLHDCRKERARGPSWLTLWTELGPSIFTIGCHAPSFYPLRPPQTQSMHTSYGKPSSIPVCVLESSFLA